MAYNIPQKLKDNIRAIEIALDWQTGQQLDEPSILSLKKYAGFGGIKAILFPEGPMETWEEMGATDSDLRLYPDIQRLHELLHHYFQGEDYQTIVQSLKNSCLTAFYTPAVIPGALYAALRNNDLQPLRLYEPSAGAGIFVTEAVNTFERLTQVTAVEKDELTGRILNALGSVQHIPVKTIISGLEQTGPEENGKFDFVVSNIPFGDYPVYDGHIKDRALTSRIHNYFFAKGLDKLADGGIMAYITTSSFLNTPGNQPVREYLFSKADFISLCIMPDNLMKDTGNTEAPSHLLIVQKNELKQGLKETEQALLTTEKRENEYGQYNLNSYLSLYLQDEMVLGEQRPGKDQYGHATEEVWQDGDLDVIGYPLQATLSKNIAQNLDKEKFLTCLSLQPTLLKQDASEAFTYLDIPSNQVSSATVQLDIFGASAENINRAMAYINAQDAMLVDKNSAMPLAILREKTDAQKEAIVIVTARGLKGKQFLFKVYSNVGEVNLPAQWMNETDLQKVIDGLRETLKGHHNHLDYEGQAELEDYLGFYKAAEVLIEEELPIIENGALIIFGGQAGTIADNDTGKKVFRPLNNQSQLPFYRQYITLRDGYLELSVIELGGQQADQVLRDKVNIAYEALLASHGRLNSAKNQKLLSHDKAYGMTMLFSVEKRSKEGFEKADILTQSIVKKIEVYRTDNCIDALARCLNDTGGVDMNFIQSATGKQFETVYRELSGHVYLNPENLQWETADNFLSGNVVSKLHIAEEQAKQRPDDAVIKQSLEALKSAQPEMVPFELLEFNLGERWIPIDIYERYAKSVFDTNVKISYLESSDSYKVNPEIKNSKIELEYAVSPKSGNTMYGQTLMQHAMVNTSPYFTYEVLNGDTVTRKPDNVAIQLAFEKIENLRAGFGTWLKSLPEDEQTQIARLYNQTYNCYRLRTYDGKHLTFPGLDLKALKMESLYPSQTGATWRIIQNRGGLIDHAVGLGKTMIMILAAMEMRRLGIAHKPMILALKANVDEIADTFRKAYPNANILAPELKDFEKKNRMRLFQEIKNNNWDCIIISHEQFSKIPQSPEIQKEILEIELIHLEKDLTQLLSEGTEASKKLLKGLEKRKENLIYKIKHLTDDITQKNDLGINFSQMGIDHLFIDESHHFKNLTFTTRHSRVAGLGNQIGSQKALNMLFAIRSLQKKFDADLCATFLSGTTISNSLTELYIIFKYLRPKELKRQKIENFDSWAAVYAMKTSEFEFSVTNEIILKERFRDFIKLPELGLFYSEITDYKTAIDIALDKPEMDEELVDIPQTLAEGDFSARLMSFAKSGDATVLGRAPLTAKEDIGRMLIATNYAKKMAVDMRLIREDYEDHPDNKISVSARNIAKIYAQSRDYKGTQVVFSDIGTPKPGEFNVYDGLRNKLVKDFAIPRQEIAFIHEYTTSDQKRALFKKLNEGSIRILIGSTAKAGTGCNYQNRIVAIHHLDIPWRPSDLEQRNGRGSRKGNWVAKLYHNNKVKIFIYAKVCSLDAYKFNLLKNKQTFIDQLKTCSLGVRRISEGSMDDQNGMGFSEYIAILSGNTTLLDKAKLDKRIAVLESSKAIHMRQCASAKIELQNNIDRNRSAKAMLERIDVDEQRYQSLITYRSDGTKNNPIELDKFASDDSTKIGNYLIDLYRNWNADIELQASEKIGSLFGFELHIQRDYGTVPTSDFMPKKIWENTYKLISPYTGISYTYNNGRPNVDNPKLAARIFLNAIDRVSSLKTQYEKQITETLNNIQTLEELCKKPYGQDTELENLKAESREMDLLILKDIDPQKMDSVDEDGVIQEVKEITETSDNLKQPQEVLIIESNSPHPSLEETHELQKTISREAVRSVSKIKSGR